MAMAFDPATFGVDRVLRDGGSIHLRAIRPDDKTRLVEHFERLSAQSVYFRFFRVKRRLSDAELRQFTELDVRRQVALVATLRRNGGEEIIGVGRYARLDSAPAEPVRAEVAFAVTDAHQRRGIGTVLLEHLAAIARADGVEVFEADVLGENNAMLAVFMQSGYRVTRALADGVFHLSFPTDATPIARAAQHRRERAAAAASVRALLAPRSVAVVDTAAPTGSLSGIVLEHLVRGGFRGPLYPIHLSATTVGARPAQAGVSAIGQPVDLAIIAVPTAAVEAVVEDCARAGVRGAVVLSGGFGECGEAGRIAERRLTALVRGAGMRLIGPNSIGVLNTDPAVSLQATIAPQAAAPGNVGMLSQSGALALAVLERSARVGLGLSSFVSAGNQADVSNNDLLAYWAEDERTAVIVLYLESFGNPRTFARVAPEVARRKPIVAVKAARSLAGMRPARSHSAATETLDVAVDALFAQVGVIRTDTLGELFELVSLLSSQPLPAGPRVGVVTNSGGLATLFADAAEGNGLIIPELAAAAGAAPPASAAAGTGLANPVDLLVSAAPQHYAAALAQLGSQATIDAVVAIYVTPLAQQAECFAAAIARGAGAVPADKPVAAVFLAGDSAPAALHAGPRGRLPVYDSPESAARALAAAWRYADWRRRPAGAVLELAPAAIEAARAVLERAQTGSAAPCWLASNDIAAILCAAGIRNAMAEQVDPADAVSAAARLGFPLVMKAVAPGLSGRRAAGAVLLGLRSAADVAGGVATLRQRIANLEAVELQRAVEGGAEAMVEVITVPTFGALVVCGIAGAVAELARDRAYRMPPVTDVEAEAMLAQLRLAPLLDAGGLPADRAALIDIIRRVSALVEALPEMRRLVLEPVMVLPGGRGATVVGAQLCVAGDVDPPPAIGPGG